MWDIQDLLDFKDPSLSQATKAHIESSYNNTVEPDQADRGKSETIDLDNVDADLFQPAPTHWKQIMNLPLHLRQHWAKSFRTELKTLLKMNTFVAEDKPQD